MKTKPVKRYVSPSYPTRLEILEDPALLEKNLPSGWRRSAEILSAAAILLSMNACISSGDDNKQKPAVVAPIFEHGEGRGSAGCIAVNPPAFLSEEEAIQVIAEELKKAGIDVSNKDVTLNNVPVPIKGKLSEAEKAYFKGKDKWELDIFDNEKNIAVEFISREDYPLVLYPRYFSSVQEYDFRKAAKSLAKEIHKKEKGYYFGTFYDPMTKRDLRSRRGGVSEIRVNLKEESEALLKEQVTDFVEWLKGQGVI